MDWNRASLQAAMSDASKEMYATPEESQSDAETAPTDPDDDVIDADYVDDQET